MCVYVSPVRPCDDLFTVDDQELLEDLTAELLAALCAVRVPTSGANTHVLYTHTHTHTYTHTHTLVTQVWGLSTVMNICKSLLKATYK